MKNDFFTEEDQAAAAMKAFKKLKPGQKRQAVNRGYIDLPVGTVHIKGQQQSAGQRHRHQVKGRRAHSGGAVALFKRVWVPGKYYAGSKLYTAVCGKHEYQFGPNALEA